ncbi:hypothetical protein [Nitrosomonas sp. Nm34]|uniref:hypothetical protein n=1 Tax=Nitrosomonas sp. Nm34 TaxID=1881055 RepID=UPI0008E699E4|nr:hypothetical protein [Nitrosomonas sp. Nm34]SFI50936.1 hypothetical protein SAMN05428978_101414 [Nitrosomonas sp. Nm34]
MDPVYIIEDGFIIEEDYIDLIESFAEKITTPSGVRRKNYVDEAIWFRVSGDLFEEKSEAELVTDNIFKHTGSKPELEKVLRYEGCEWRDQGNFCDKISVFDTKEKAYEWLFDCAVNNFKNNSNSPLIFKTKKDAENYLEDLSE